MPKGFHSPSVEGHGSRAASVGDLLYSRTSYSKATPSGSFSSNQVSAASAGYVAVREPIRRTFGRVFALDEVLKIIRETKDRLFGDGLEVTPRAAA
jgi:hypothetical protein